MSMIKALVMDVDGTLTDGGIYIGPTGEVLKVFNVKDGYGIKEVLSKYGITPIIITGRQSDILEYRCKELGIDLLFQGVRDKVGTLKSVMNSIKVSGDEVAYIGDDLNDLSAMELCGVRGCPADAVNAVKDVCDYVSVYEGGRGAVRDFIDYLTAKND